MRGLVAGVLAALAVAVWTGVRLRVPAVRFPRRRGSDDAAALWVRVVDAIADELRSGAAVTSAFESAHTALVLESVEVSPASFAASLGPEARAQRLPELAHLGLALDVAHTSGASLAQTLDHIADSLRARIEDRALVGQELASTKATVVVLACLPVIGAAMAAALGGQTITWLMGTSLGRLCLGGGALLQAAGLWWIRRMVHGVEL